MKIFSIICLLLVCFSIQSQISLFGRDFITGLLTTVKGKDFVLDENCLSAEFDKDCENLADAIKSGNVFKGLAAAAAIKDELQRKCPANEVTKIFKDTMDLGTLEIMSRFAKHRQEMTDLLKEELFHKITAKNMGEFFGKMVNIIVYGMSHNLSFLAETDYFTTESVEEFVNGFFEGVSSVPFDQNKCYQDISGVKVEIVQVVQEVIQAFKNKSEIISALSKLVDIVFKLKDVSSNCNFIKLGTSLASLATKIGIAKFGYKVLRNLSAVFGDIKGVYSGVESKDFKKAGVSVGNFFKLTLDYSTN